VGDGKKEDRAECCAVREEVNGIRKISFTFDYLR
jgi:hypothetical protein